MSETPDKNIIVANKDRMLPVEASAAYWAEKLRQSGEYDIFMSSFNPNWEIGGKRLEEFYPKAPSSGQGFLKDGSLLGKLGSEFTIPGANKEGEKYFKKAAILLATPQFTMKFPVNRGAPKPDSPFWQKLEYKEWGDAVQLFGNPGKTDISLGYEEARILKAHSKNFGNQEGKTWQDYSNDRQKTYLVYHHPLRNTDTHGRAGNALQLVFGLPGSDANEFMDLVKNNPYLLDRMIEELFPNLVRKDQVSRTRVENMLVVIPTQSPRGLRPAQIATREYPFAPYERFDVINLDPPIGEE